jgi:hypothetical protein
VAKYGPTRTELRIRLWFSIAGLALTAGALVLHGLPSTPGGWEAVGLGTLFFGGTLVWTALKLWRGDHSG